LASLPLSFEANRGQTDDDVKFVSRSSAYTLFLTASEAVLVLRQQESPVGGTVVRMRLAGAEPQPQVRGAEELGRVNYLIGSDRSRWRTGIPTFRKVAYYSVYPGIDLVYHGPEGHLRYDFIVQPGADPEVVSLTFQGVDRLELDPERNLVLHTPLGTLRQSKPVIYQEIEGSRREIGGGFVLQSDQQVRFQVAAYDRSRPLVIDPTLVYSTYLGGNGGSTEAGAAIGVDALGNAYVTGGSDSTNFPSTAGAIQPTLTRGPDVFVTKFDPTGATRVYSTYLGGNGHDFGLGIAVDALGNAYVTGSTSSTNFPTTAGSFQRIRPTPSGPSLDYNAFVTKLDPTGATLVYSTYLGGGMIDGSDGIAVDALGNAYVTGHTTSANFPTTAGAFQRTRADVDFGDAFVTKLDRTGATLVYSTYVGGGSSDVGHGMAVDARGSAYVTGWTSSTNFPSTAGAFQRTRAGVIDAFVTKLDPTGAALVYSTYLGGNGSEGSPGRENGIAVDAVGNAYVMGRTNSTDFPTTAGAFQRTLAGGDDAFVTKVDPTGATLVYSTYLGGRGRDWGGGIALDATGSAYVAGRTNSTNFPTMAGAFQPTLAGADDVFVTKLDPTGAALAYSTYLGGRGADWGEAIAVDALGRAYVTGQTTTGDFPTTAGASQPAFAGGMSDAFVAKIEEFATGAPTAVQASVNGTTLTVSWVAGSGSPPTTHVLNFFQGGVPVASLTTGASQSVQIGIPNGVSGTFTVTVTAAGGTSVPASFTIGGCVPPLPVTGLTGAVAAGTATAGWDPSLGATGYVVQAGASQGGAELFNGNVGNITSISASGLPPGFTAWVRVIAVNACGSSPPQEVFLH
jgi:hypothetical protein